MKLVTRFTMVLTGGMLSVAIAGGAGLALMYGAVQTYRGQVQAMNAHARAIGAIRSSFQTQVQEWKNVLLRGHDPVQRDKYWAGFQHSESEVGTTAQRLREALHPGAARELVAGFVAAHRKLGARYRQGLQAFAAADYAAVAGDAAVKGIDREATESLQRAIEAISADAGAAAAAADQRADRALFASMAAMLLVTAFAGTALALHLRRCLRRLDVTVSAVGRVAQGDLSQPVIVPPGGDELSLLAHAAADMQHALTAVVTAVRSNADSVAVASGQIAQGNLDLSARTERQAAALQESTATMNELDATVRQTAEQAARADRVARDAAQQAHQGGQAMAGVVSTMSDISATARRIGEIVGVIDSIAFQTNLLALNAAVEAARAGELGRGFAVVAAEVRALAGRSATAAREIRDLVARSSTEVGTGNERVTDAGRAMDDIVAAIASLGALVGEISTACANQSDGVRQVGAAVTDIDHATQKNAALVEQSAAATASLKQQAQALVATVAVFRVPAVT